MIASGGVCIAYETVQLPDRSLPLLIPMSEVAGRMATINGAYYLQKTKGGKGKLICGVPGVKPAKVLVLGGGVVGQAAARVAAGMGAQVIITDIYPAREEPIEGVTSKLIYDRLAPNVEKQLITKDDVIPLVKSRSFDVLIVLGAGDLDEMVPQIANILKRKMAKENQ